MLDAGIIAIIMASILGIERIAARISSSTCWKLKVQMRDDAEVPILPVPPVPTVLPAPEQVKMGPILGSGLLSK